MQTLRKLPKHSPRMAAPMSRIGSATTGHLEEEDARRDRDVQRFGPLGQRDRHALGGHGVELRPDARALVADDDGDRAGAARRTARGSGSPSAAVAHSVTSCWRAQAMNAASSNGTTGWRNVAPIAARNALGLSVSAVPRRTMVPAAPRAWAVRVSAPPFPGAWDPST